MSNRKEITAARVIMATFLIGGLGLIFFHKREFLGHHSITSGIVTNVSTAGYKSTADYKVFYEYWVGPRKYTTDDGYVYCQGQSIAKLKSLLVGKRFPVAYGDRQHWLSSIILTQNDADKLEYHLPDSLKSFDSILTCK